MRSVIAPGIRHFSNVRQFSGSPRSLRELAMTISQQRLIHLVVYPGPFYSLFIKITTTSILYNFVQVIHMQQNNINSNTSLMRSMWAIGIFSLLLVLAGTCLYLFSFMVPSLILISVGVVGIVSIGILLAWDNEDQKKKLDRDIRRLKENADIISDTLDDAERTSNDLAYQVNQLNESIHEAQAELTTAMLKAKMSQEGKLDTHKVERSSAVNDLKVEDKRANIETPEQSDPDTEKETKNVYHEERHALGLRK